MVRMSRRRARSVVPLLVCGGLLLACAPPEGGGDAEGTGSAADATATAPDGERPTATPTGTSEPTPSAEPSGPEPTEAADTRPERCRGLGEAELQGRVDRLGADVEEAMAGYDGEWSFGLVDLDCDVELAVNEQWVAYPASAGKIVPVIAALRAVEDGDLAIEDIEEELLGVMEHSWDADADVINALVTPEQVREVLELAEVSDATDFEHRWGRADMPALDLARVWAALLDGRLLEERAEYLLDLAEGPQIPPGLDTFPVDPQMPGWQLGQKAGYWVSSGTPYMLLGAGYLRPEPGSEAAADQQGIVVVLHVRSQDPDLHEPQRRSVFPLVREYADPG